jgi:hypothetical protein
VGSFGLFLLISALLAAVPPIVTLLLSQLGPFPNPDLAMRALGVNVWCSVACIVLLIIGLVRFRLRGLWLAIPVVVALALPTWVIVTLGNEMDDCLKHQATTGNMCVP